MTTPRLSKQDRATILAQQWSSDARWQGVVRPYSAMDVVNLSGSVTIDYTLARLGAIKFWRLLHEQSCVSGLGALTGNQAIQEVAAGLPAIYVSGWQVAADANSDSQMYPDQSLYASTSVPSVVRRINNALMRRDQIEYLESESESDSRIDYLVPLIADCDAGFGGNLNAYELMKSMIEVGAAGVHFEDQNSNAKRCGHMGGKVLVPTREAIEKLVAARLAADVSGVPTVIIARTDAESATMLTSDIDPRDHEFLTGERSSEGHFHVRSGLDQAINRGLAYAPYADLLWMETSNPDLEMARLFAEAIHEKFPGKLLAYNCSPSFNWAKFMTNDRMLTFREDLARLGFRFQFITLFGFHTLNTSMFETARAYMEKGMLGFSSLQQREFALEKEGFKATRHQAFVGTGYFDAIQNTIQQKQSSTCALVGSTEEDQFH